MPLLGETVEASREKRLERQQARFRDRGGIFKPSGHNALLDMLLARGVNGESPSRANSPRRSRSRSASPSRKHTNIQSSTHASHPAPTKRASRKSEGRKVEQQDTHESAYTEAMQNEEEGIVDPSSHTTRTKAGKGRRTKATTKKSRSQASITQTQTQARNHDTATEPGPSQRPAKGSRAKKSIASTSTPKRDEKRSASAPEPVEEPTLSTHDLSDDEPLRPQKKPSEKDKRKAKASAPGELLSVAEGKELKGDVGVSESHKARRRGGGQADTTRTSTTAEKSVTSWPTSNLTAKQTRQQEKGKRKARAIVTDGDDDELGSGCTGTPSSSQCTETGRADPHSTKKYRAKKKDVPQLQNHVDDRNSERRQASLNAQQKSRSTDHSESIPAIDVNKTTNSKTKTKKQKLTTLTAAEYDENDQVLPSPSVQASPDLPPAQTLRPSQKPSTNKIQSPKRKDTDDTVQDTPPPPRKKRRRPEDMAVPAAIEHKRPPSLVDNTIRKASRTKAPPVLAPKGTVLKPKPRPRLSLFPAPTLEEDSEDDPINFLS
ncbi:hypothetical protein C8Q73DRAFT_790557 [Cubamyces lactineus]|nr:hypothetical protein C8Q73DRAFT_790557 [Cubamyces lactineus]